MFFCKLCDIKSSNSAMCTVTLVHLDKSNFIITFNRDETIHRSTLLPAFYELNQTRALFPKDAVAGGTWIGLNDKNTMVCLLNGGFKIHEKRTNYRQSRGIVVKDVLEAKNIQKTLLSYVCVGIEPFTIVTADWQS